jgi:uncharacterized protein YbjT (DUF2867 family)
MKYVITGGAGNISKPLALRLLEAGHEVTVIGRNPGNLEPLTNKGAKAAIGSVEDIDSLKTAFTGADAVYTMVPPNMGAQDWKAYIAGIGQNYAAAIRASGVKHVVNLSSIGADLPEGCGPVTGLHHVEQALNSLQDVHVLHLRPGYFFSNYFGSIGMVKGMNLLGGNSSRAEDKMILVDTEDIAEAAAEELQGLRFTGHSVRYVASDERTPVEVASVLGKAIGKPDLPYVEFSDEDTLNGLRGAGLPDEIAKNYTEMGQALRSGAMGAGYWKNRPQTLGTRKLENFAKQFAQAYGG